MLATRRALTFSLIKGKSGRVVLFMKHGFDLYPRLRIYCMIWKGTAQRWRRKAKKDKGQKEIQRQTLFKTTVKDTAIVG